MHIDFYYIIITYRVFFSSGCSGILLVSHSIVHLTLLKNTVHSRPPCCIEPNITMAFYFPADLLGLQKCVQLFILMNKAVKHGY